MVADENGLTTDSGESQTILTGGLEEPQQATEEHVEEAPAQESEGNVAPESEGSVQDMPKWLEQSPRDMRDRLAKLGHGEYRAFLEDAIGMLEKRDSYIQRPAEDAPKEEWDQFYASVGRPDDPDGYELPEQGELTPEFKKTAYELGLSGEQAKKLYDWYETAQTQQAQAIVESQKEESKNVVSTLKEEWGDSTDENLANIKRFISKYGNEQLRKELDRPEVGNNLELVRVLAKAGADLAGDAIVEGRPATGEQAGKKAPHLSYSWMREAYPPKDE